MDGNAVPGKVEASHSMLSEQISQTRLPCD